MKKRLTLYQRLKPEVKSKLQENYGEFEFSVKMIFKSLHEEEHYNALTVNQVNQISLFSDVYPKTTYELFSGNFAFKEI
jgi:hypothetical protein|tara:strand:+ start:506 stop:742 length:237 start_codon:yes stop_codon:yes gene_type:complete